MCGLQSDELELSCDGRELERSFPFELEVVEEAGGVCGHHFYVETVSVRRTEVVHAIHLIPPKPQHSTAQHSTAQHSTAQHSTAQHSTSAAAKRETSKRERERGRGYVKGSVAATHGPAL